MLAADWPRLAGAQGSLEQCSGSGAEKRAASGDRDSQLGRSLLSPLVSSTGYHAPEHRVLTNPLKPRYSAPFFYNPAYAAAVAPLPSLGAAQFDELVWGYFRAQRFAGDFADYGTEIQISDFAKGSGSWHVNNQARFLAATDFRLPFSVEANRPLLSNPKGL